MNFTFLTAHLIVCERIPNTIEINFKINRKWMSKNADLDKLDSLIMANTLVKSENAIKILNNDKILTREGKRSMVT